MCDIAYKRNVIGKINYLSRVVFIFFKLYHYPNAGFLTNFPATPYSLIRKSVKHFDLVSVPTKATL
jgi:hypothetical protein